MAFLKRIFDDQDDDQSTPVIAAPSVPTLAPGNYPPVVPPSTTDAPAPAVARVQPPSRLTTDQAKLDADTQAGSGVHQFGQNHKYLGILPKIADVMGSVIAPNLAVRIPGTTLHHNQVLNQDQQRIGQDLSSQKEQADIARTQQETAAAGQPKPKEEDWEPVPEMQGPQGEPVLREKNSGDMKLGALPTGATRTQKPPTTEFEQFANEHKGQPDIAEQYNKLHKTDTPDALDKQYLEAINKGDHETALRILQVQRDLAAAKQAPERPQKDQRVLGVINGKVVELRPGMDVPAGAQTLTGELAGNKPNADEQKRADMAKNLNENLDALEEIVNRRPGLFGPIAGRIAGAKETIGTDDPDIAALENIKHQLGMAQNSAHGMRSAQGVVAAAQALANFHNSPEALKGAINSARHSVATFTQDAQRGKVAPPAGGNAGGASDPLGIR